MKNPGGARERSGILFFFYGCKPAENNANHAKATRLE
jgi:hypothetical protein